MFEQAFGNGNGKTMLQTATTMLEEIGNNQSIRIHRSIFLNLLLNHFTKFIIKSFFSGVVQV